MNTSLGYAKRTLNDTNVLLSGGGDKPLSDFIGSISWDSTNKKIKYTPVGASSATDLVTFGSNAFNSTSFVTTNTVQTISATKTFASDNLGEAITVKRNDSLPSAICFSNNGGILGYIGVSNGIPGFWDSSKNVSALLTQNNWSTYVGTSSAPVGYATNIAGGAQGSIPYLTAAGTTAFLAGGTNGYVLAYDTTNKAPYWKADSNTKYYLTLNGVVKGTASTTNLGTIYAPTTAGTGFLKGTAGDNGTITWSWDNNVIAAGVILSGTTSDTVERQVGVRSAAGTLYMYAQGSSTGNRGLYIGAHGNGSEKGVITIDTNNNVTFYGDVSGNATSASIAGSATYSTYLASNTGGIAANTTNSLTYYNTCTTTTLNTTNGIANPTTTGSGTWYHHITMVRGDSNGFFFDLAFSLADANNPKIYFRNRAASTYSAWTEIVTSANVSDYLSGGGSITLKNKTFSSLGSNTTYRLVYAYNQSTTEDSTLTTLYQTNGLYVNNNGVYHTSDIAYKEAIDKYVLKKNILDLENPIKKFKWKGTKDEAVGFIAQETEEWCPEAVGQDEDGYKTVNYTVALSGLCSALYDEIKNLKKEIEELKNKK